MQGLLQAPNVSLLSTPNSHHPLQIILLDQIIPTWQGWQLVEDVTETFPDLGTPSFIPNSLSDWDLSKSMIVRDLKVWWKGGRLGMGHSREDEGSPIVMEVFWGQAVPGTRQRHGVDTGAASLGQPFPSYSPSYSPLEGSTLARSHISAVPYPSTGFCLYAPHNWLNKVFCRSLGNQLSCV